MKKIKFELLDKEETQVEIEVDSVIIKYGVITFESAVGSVIDIDENGNSKMHLMTPEATEKLLKFLLKKEEYNRIKTLFSAKGRQLYNVNMVKLGALLYEKYAELKGNLEIDNDGVDTGL